MLIHNRVFDESQVNRNSLGQFTKSGITSAVQNVAATGKMPTKTATTKLGQTIVDKKATKAGDKALRNALLEKGSLSAIEAKTIRTGAEAVKRMEMWSKRQKLNENVRKIKETGKQFVDTLLERLNQSGGNVRTRKR